MDHIKTPIFGKWRWEYISIWIRKPSPPTKISAWQYGHASKSKIGRTRMNLANGPGARSMNTLKAVTTSGLSPISWRLNSRINSNLQLKRTWQWRGYQISNKDPTRGKCYVNCDINNWHFHANLSSRVLPIQNGDSAHIVNMWKHNSLATLS